MDTRTAQSVQYVIKRLNNLSYIQKMQYKYRAFIRNIFTYKHPLCYSKICREYINRYYSMNYSVI